MKYLIIALIALYSATATANEYCSADSLNMALTAFNKGNEVALCRGGSWNTDGSLRMREKGTVWQAHGDGDNPLITSSSNVFTMYNGVGGFTINDVTLVGTGESKNKGVFMYNGVHDIILENMDISNFYIGVQNQGGELGPNNNLTMTDMTINDNRMQGFLGGGSNLLMERVKFARNGTSKVLDHNIYVSVSDGSGGPATNLRFIDVESVDSSGVHFVIHGKADGILVDNFRAIEHDLTNYGAWGFAATAGHSSTEYFHNMELRNSYFENTGNHFATCTDCDGAYFHDNEFVFKGSPPTTVYGIKIPSGKADGPTSTAKVTDNTFWIIDQPEGSLIVAIDLTGLTGQGEVHGNKIFFEPGTNVICIAGRDNDDVGDNYCGPEADYNPIDNTDKAIELLEEALILLKQ